MPRRQHATPGRICFVLLFIAVSALVPLTGCSSGGSSKNPAATSTVPQVLNISPTTGSPGTIVTIQGTNFGILQGTSTVTYAGVTLTATSWSNTQITVTIPSNAITNGVFIVNVGGQISNTSAAFTITEPQLTGVSPASGLPGTQVTLTGRGFGTSQGRSYVAFNGQLAQVTTWSDSYIVCLVPTPSNTSPGNVSVVVWIDGSKSTNAQTFTILLPTISGFNKSIVNVGALVTINGSGFGSTQGQVLFNSTPVTPTYWIENSIQFRVPQVTGPGAYNVAVVCNGRTSTPLAITVAPPQVTSSPANAINAGTTVTIQGYYFGSSQTEGYSTITYLSSSNVQQAVTISSWSDMAITFICPSKNGVIFNETKTMTLTVGGLSTTFSLTIN